VERSYRAIGSSSATEIRVTEAAVNGLESWVTTAGLTSHTKTVLSGNGNSTTTVTFPDGTKSVTGTTVGRITSVTRLSSAGAQSDPDGVYLRCPRTGPDIDRCPDRSHHVRLVRRRSTFLS